MNTTVAPSATQLNPRFHPFVAIFPEMDAAAFAALVADIKVNGVHEPVTVYKNQIVDGKNRWRACEQLGIPCPQRVYEGKENDGDLLAFVVSKNLHRRQMSESQRAMVAARIANMTHGGDRRSDQAATLPLVSQAEAGKLADGVSERSVRDAVKVIAKAVPEVVRAVELNKLPVSAAAKVAGHPPEVQRQAAAKIDDGAKPADVVRALPGASSGKAKPCAPALPKEEKKALEVWATMMNLLSRWRHGHDEELWELSPYEFLPLLDRASKDQLAEIAKMLMPWLKDIIDQHAQGSKVGAKPKLVTKSAGVQ